MNERQIRAYKAASTALVFFNDKNAKEGDLTHLRTDRELSHLYRRLRVTVDAIERGAVDQRQTGGRLVVFARRQLEQVREKHMLPLARLTRRVFAGEPKIELALRVPHKRAPSDDLLAAAEAMVKALQPHRRLLAASNIDPQRLTRLREETRIARKALVAANASTPKRTLATRRLPALLASARADVEAIDAIMTATASEYELSRWRGMSRVGKRIGRPKVRRSPARAAIGDAHWIAGVTGDRKT